MQFAWRGVVADPCAEATLVPAAYLVKPFSVLALEGADDAALTSSAAAAR